MSNSDWIDQTKKYAANNGISYNQALKDPSNRLQYHSNKMSEYGAKPWDHPNLVANHGDRNGQAKLAKTYHKLYKMDSKKIN